MGPVVVAIDVGADCVAGLRERFELLALHAALLELGKRGLDDAWDSGSRRPPRRARPGARPAWPGTPGR